LSVGVALPPDVDRSPVLPGGHNRRHLPTGEALTCVLAGFTSTCRHPPGL